MVFNNEHANPCANCQALCCQNVVLNLSDTEADFLRQGGTNLIESEAQAGGVVRKIVGNLWQRLAGRYYHMDICGYLNEDQNGRLHCSVHDDKRRPAICKSFASGSTACRGMISWQRFRRLE